MVLAAERMRHTDAFLWYMEDDPLLRSTILAITLLEGTLDWEYLRARMDRASRALPMFRQRVQPPPLRLGPPWRTPAPDFDLDYHTCVGFGRRSPLTGAASSTSPRPR